MPHPLRFDPIARARELWRQRWGAASPAPAMAAATSIMRVQQLLVVEFDAALAPLGLTFARYEALVLLQFSAHGELPMSKIGERLMIHPTSATNIIQRLAGQDLVTRVPNPRDGRGTLARITPAGREVMERGTQVLHGLDFGLPMLAGEQLEQLFELLRTVRVARGDFAVGG